MAQFLTKLKQIPKSPAVIVARAKAFISWHYITALIAYLECSSKGCRNLSYASKFRLRKSATKAN